MKICGFLKGLLAGCVASGVVFAGDSEAFRYQVAPLSGIQLTRMQHTCWHSGCPAPLTDLVAVRVKYWDFQQKNHWGELVVNKKVVADVVDIFRALYYQHFPIANMQPMEQFRGDDDKAMAANNTSGFNCRMMTGNPGKFSQHSFGAAIDINPWQNPYVDGQMVQPAEGRKYLQRTDMRAGMIRPETPIYALFKSKGWEWGGDWNDPKDYQHFEK